jgi:hypothetical protein
MPRTSADVTPEEIQAFEKFCVDHRIVTDGQIGEQNVLAIGDYLIDTWKVGITADTLKIALEKLGDRIVLYSEVEARYRKIAAENLAKANQLHAWLHGPGNTSLVKDGDQGFENQTALLVELKGREISSREIQNAIGRLSFKSGLHFVPAPRPVDSRQHTDDGRGFMPKDSVNLTTRDHARLAAEARAAASGNKPPATTDYRSLAEAVKGPTHSKTEQIQRAFVTGDRGVIDWEKTYIARRKMAGL